MFCPFLPPRRFLAALLDHFLCYCFGCCLASRVPHMLVDLPASTAALPHCFPAHAHASLAARTAGVAASLVSQPSDTIMVEVNDNDGGEVNILETVRSKTRGGHRAGKVVARSFLFFVFMRCLPLVLLRSRGFSVQHTTERLRSRRRRRRHRCC